MKQEITRDALLELIQIIVSPLLFSPDFGAANENLRDQPANNRHAHAPHILDTPGHEANASTGGVTNYGSDLRQWANERERKIENLVVPHLQQALRNLELIQNELVESALSDSGADSLANPCTADGNFPNAQTGIPTGNSARQTLETGLNGLPLSQREREIAALVMQGMSNKDIATKLFITVQTVKDHLHHIFGKLHIRRRGELVSKVLGL